MSSNAGEHLIRRLMLTVLAGVVAIGLAFSPMMPGLTGGFWDTPGASAASEVGGINFGSYCARKYGGSAVVIAPFNAWSWRCEVRTWQVGFPSGVSVSWQYKPIDTNEACRWQYGNSAWSKAKQTWNAWSWACYR